MVTYEALFLFGSLIVAIIALVVKEALNKSARRLGARFCFRFCVKKRRNTDMYFKFFISKNGSKRCAQACGRFIQSFLAVTKKK